MPAEPLPTLLPENGTANFAATLLDERGIPVPQTDLLTLTLTLYLRLDPRTIINSRNGQDVMNANGGTYHATTGAFAITLTPGDNAIVGRTRSGRVEEHIALFEWTFGEGPKGGNHEFLIRVEARHHVP